MGDAMGIARHFTLFGFQDRSRFVDGLIQIVVDDDIIIAVDPIQFFPGLGQAAGDDVVRIGLAAAEAFSNTARLGGTM